MSDPSSPRNNLAELIRQLEEIQTGVGSTRGGEGGGLPEILRGLQRVLEELKRSEGAAAPARELEARCAYYQDLFEYAPDGHLVTDLNGETIREANRAASSLLRMVQQQLVGRSLLALAPEEERPGFREEVLRLRQRPTEDGMREQHIRLQPENGTAFQAGLTVAPVHDAAGEPAALNWSVRDISERVRTAEALRKSEARLRVILDTAFNGMITFDERGIVESFNRAAEQMFGYPAGEVIGRNLVILWPSSPEVTQEVYRQRGPAVAGPAPVGAVREVEARRRDGTTFPAEVVVSEMWLEDQHFFHAIIRDIGERKRAEESLRQQRDFAESLIETAQAIVLVLDREGRIVRFNPYLEEVAGHPLEEVRGQDWLDTFVAEANRACMRDLLSQVLAGARIRGRVCPLVTRAGREREVGWCATMLRNGRGEAVGVLLVGYDCTELKEAQEQALQAGRLAAIGQMVAGLAHESRNALQRSQAGLERLLLRFKGQPEVCALLDEVQEAQDRLHRLHEEVRVYAGPMKLELRVCNLADVWREAWAYLEAQRKGRQAVLHEEAVDLGRDFVADPYRLEQVFANILSNCLAACADPVRIEVRCAETELEGRPALRVTVCDNGPGLNREQREKIFEPFYTTKTRGTGLGMAIAKRIVEAHGGRIDLGGEGCPGAEIAITLPRRER